LMDTDTDELADVVPYYTRGENYRDFSGYRNQ